MKILFDLHTHTIVSGHAYSTVKENVEFAKKNGLLAYGFSDHSSAMEGAAPDIYFVNFKVIPEKINDVLVFGGVESNIIDYEGNIDLPNFVTEKVEYIIASLHINCIKPGTIEENTKAILKAMENPLIKIIGHPDDSRFLLDYEQIVLKAKETNTLLEVNNSSLNPNGFRLNTRQNVLKYLELCKKHQVKVILGTDSHFCTEVGIFNYALEVLKEVDFPEELVVNTNLENLKFIMNRSRFKK